MLLFNYERSYETSSATGLSKMQHNKCPRQDNLRTFQPVVEYFLKNGVWGNRTPYSRCGARAFTPLWPNCDRFLNGSGSLLRSSFRLLILLLFLLLLLFTFLLFLTLILVFFSTFVTHVCFSVIKVDLRRSWKYSCSARLSYQRSAGQMIKCCRYQF